MQPVASFIGLSAGKRRVVQNQHLGFRTNTRSGIGFLRFTSPVNLERLTYLLRKRDA